MPLTTFHAGSERPFTITAMNATTAVVDSPTRNDAMQKQTIAKRMLVEWLVRAMKRATNSDMTTEDNASALSNTPYALSSRPNRSVINTT